MSSRLVGVGWHEASTAVLPAAYPFLADAPLPAAGCYIGRNLFGGAFHHDPFTLYAAGLSSNPNMLIAGDLGSGKSTLVKTLLLREHVRGRSAFVADPKGEYAPLAAALGVTPLKLGPGCTDRLNPLDPPEGADLGQRLLLVTALAAAALDRPLTPTEHAALDIALSAVLSANTTALLINVVDTLLTPTTTTATDMRLTVGQLTDASRDLALVLRRMCSGDLAGMFDGPTTRRPHPSDPLVVLDLSALYQTNRDALPLVLACVTSWLTTTIRTNAAQRYVVIEEAWALLAHVATARWLQQSYKLARAHGVANIAVLHRISDLLSAGAGDSEQVALARGLLDDVGTRVLGRQAASALRDAAAVLGLTATSATLLPQLRTGVALWNTIGRWFMVEHQRSDIERRICDTDAAMTSQRPDTTAEDQLHDAVIPAELAAATGVPGGDGEVAA